MTLIRGTVRIACACDDAYAPHLAALVASLAESRGPERIEVTLLAGPALADATIDELERFSVTVGIELNPVRMPEAALAKVATLPPFGSYSPVVWYRLFLPELLPERERVLYLDTDTLALQSLEPLYSHDLDGCVLGAVASPMSQKSVAHCRLIGMGPAEDYFNSGVLLMDLVRMRESGFTEAVLSAAATAPALTFADQDALNLACREHWLRLHPKWNALSHLWLPHGAVGARAPASPYSDLQLEAAARSPALVHFEGPVFVKPWFFRSIHPHREIYRAMRQRTPWPLSQLEGHTRSAAMLRRLPLGWQYALSRWKFAALGWLRR